ncbi:UDP-N-acetylglucosamine 1-carboxyvinyltransferase [Phosphitispora fastidiosa]|uniref:UDP-N-acetylglucosamine 1-carboxyvinyltransferase n=1 Tax=Phosphitispora fastidiosa TaxID=2837202 RepID=UPI001E46B32C|nr:UDP-N-acetylglucosamine 1-carboxyvinyltransferase [Phosphitispora fastidiosa]
MQKLYIKGGKTLEGKVRIGGAKNAALTIVCASLLAGDTVCLENMPDITDVNVLLDIITNLGVNVVRKGPDVVEITTPDRISTKTPYREVKKLRASNLLLGPLLARFCNAEIALPGGCNIGSRPMDLHIKGFEALGANISLEHGFIKGRCSRLSGSKIYLDFPSVGATENIMMAAALSKGQTVLENVAKEPEIVDLANFLNSLGAKIRGAGTDVIKIDGVDQLGGGRYSVIPDRIEAGTFMVAAAATHGDLTIENIISTHVEPLIAKLREANVEVIEDDETIRVIARDELRPIDIKTLPYPGFPTDMQSQVMAMLTVVKGTSVIVENVFENRLQVADEFKRMGAKIKVEGRTAVIQGVKRLQGAQVKASDLRAGAALILAGLIADGDTEICNTCYIDRGYEKIEQKLISLGASISRI